MNLGLTGLLLGAVTLPHLEELPPPAASVRPEGKLSSLACIAEGSCLICAASAPSTCCVPHTHVLCIYIYVCAYIYVLYAFVGVYIYLFVPGVAGMELTFLTAAPVMLCFGFVAQLHHAHH